MGQGSFGTVSALQFHTRPELDFADIVEEFDIAFQMVDSPTRSLKWDCDDVAILDRDTVRVALGWIEPAEKNQPWYMIVAAGPTPELHDSPPESGFYAAFLAYIVERTAEFLPYDAALFGDASQPVGTLLIDTVTDLLRLSENATPDDRAPDPASENIWNEAPIGSASATRETRKQRMREQARARQDWDIDGHAVPQIAAISLPKRLTIYTLSYSLLLQIPAIGAFLFVYTILRDSFPVAA